MLNNLDKFSLPEIENEVLEFWERDNIFEQAQDKNKGEDRFIFYEGPPTANGKPGIHHVLSRSFKDVILRFQAMKGKDVKRRGGWDTHGLPVELEIEKELGLSSKPEIEDYGIEKFNRKCKESVWEYKDMWEELTERMGFWIEMDDPYITYKNSYIETLWWIISQVDEKDLLYKDLKVVPWCSRCGTALSSHELAQGYEETTDRSVFVKFQLKNTEGLDLSLEEKPAFFLSWTTTPWTLPGNVALAVNRNIDYVAVDVGEEVYILAEDRKEIIEEDYEVLAEFSGKQLEGLRYKSLFEIEKFRSVSSTYKVYEADFVNTEEGTGIVHTAVMYGEDDYELGKRVGLPKIHTVDKEGKFNDLVGSLEGCDVKSEKTEDKIFRTLKENNLLYRQEDYSHEYPFCWRCDTPVIYYARESWFIEMSKLRDELCDLNEEINWIPNHIKEGRFGEWISGAKDWALSRERYWGTPLPIWECENCEERELISSLGKLSERNGGAENSYIFMRHGEAESNKNDKINSDPKNRDLVSLTKRGENQIKEAASNLSNKGIDKIITSDFERTKQTAEIVAEELGIDFEVDERLRETDTGVFDGESTEKYHNFFDDLSQKFEERPPEGENLKELLQRVWSLVEELEEKESDKNILIVSHEYPIWMLETAFKGWSKETSVSEKKKRGDDFLEVGSFKQVNLKKLPRNKWGIVDVHRPFIDEIEFECRECNSVMSRREEVLDVWFDSGAVPFGQAHYPFENKNSLDYPADYISEAMDQTRGWFYTMLAISVLLGKEEPPYKNVISLGLVLDKNGKKMSTSKGNIVEPFEAAEEYGMDVVRWHFYTANSPGDSKKFDPEELKKTLRGLILTLYNSFKFLNIYRERKISLNNKPALENPMDKWIFSRINQVSESVESDLKNYDVVEGGRKIEELVNDLSKWYIRSSRDRFQNPDSQEGFDKSCKVLVSALLRISKIISPFTPFTSEALYQSIKNLVVDYDFKNSVHLEEWPESGEVDKDLIDNMSLVRRIVSKALSEREAAEVKLRQPLSVLRVGSKKLEGNTDLIKVLKEEVNVKEVVFDSDISGIELDTEISPELKREGWLRDLMRKIQSMRKSAGLEPGDPITLFFEGNQKLERVLENNSESIKQKVSAKNLVPGLKGNFDGEKETEIDNMKITLQLKEL
ncbi:MAG: class I tRNA ligase family protein [Candidatus Magasanikbacteria bacterium]